ncbi:MULTISPECIES: AmpG family muropeptide MFS transporter [Comamonas]|uniref:MFS transporter n=1 Tax=Comamonas thiooxydans TaxID=363952 RepID=A0AA42PX80_9BURK|nr:MULTISPECIES: MFS transporter [Comamonas]KGG95918.1 MFS transporter [Comamonas thiooxydans]KGH02302.1 MFS transporter [Comamonas thiooxydans]KGH09571.1 MFS transporter [Comamonas thiooxydans]KGH16022.1 MFS transporter [Comamonas thiooxydans]MDH1332664.1 MFS transporter [Comamonas thiooxydans]
MTESSQTSRNPSSADVVIKPKRSWSQAFKVYAQPTSLRMLALGFSAGLPLLLVLGTLSFWLREADIDRTTIGFLSWVGLAYAFKWVWSPLVDRLPLPALTRMLGRRRSWLLFSQLLIVAGLLGMSFMDPKQSLQPLVLCAVLVAFGSATQDIALDAYRIESAKVDDQAALAATYQTGYRLAMIWAGAGVLWVAAQVQGDVQGYMVQAWHVAYTAMAASMLVGMITVLLSPEPEARPMAPARNAAEWIKGALIAPFADFIGRYRWQALLLLALIGLYRVSDVVMGIMANPFYVDMGYTKEEVAAVTKVFGVIMTLLGGFVGGTMAVRWGVMRVLMLGAVLSACTNILFAWLATRGHDVSALVWVVSADNLAGGIASAAFIAYLSGLTNVQYSATQYALFSSMMLLAPKWLAGFSGAFVDAYGYEAFFHTTALMGFPVLLLIFLASRVKIGSDA